MIKFYHINNLLDIFGRPDYKGLNLDVFVPGSQVLSHDFRECIIATTEDFQGYHEDLTELTEEQYIAERERIKSEYPTSTDTIQELQNRLQEAEQAVLELSILIGEVMNNV